MTRLISSQRESYAMHCKAPRVVSAIEVGSSLISASQKTLLLTNAEEEEEVDDIVTIMDTSSTLYIIEIVPDKTKIMTKCLDTFQREIRARRGEEQIPGVSHL